MSRIKIILSFVMIFLIYLSLFLVVFFNYYWFIIPFFVFIFLAAHYIDKWVAEIPPPKCNNCKYWEPIDLHNKIGNCKKRNNIITKEDQVSKHHKYKKNER